MKLTAKQAKERIISGNIQGDHEVTEDLNMFSCVIPIWPSWKFQSVNLCNAVIDKIGGTFNGNLDCRDSTLKEIDPQIQVSGDYASFATCKRLKKAQGNFNGYTSWGDSGIVEIDPRTKFGQDKHGNSARFSGCQYLLKAQGSFPGATNWKGSAIQELDPKMQLGTNDKGISADFEDCKNLNPTICAEPPKGAVLGKVNFIGKPNMHSIEF